MSITQPRGFSASATTAGLKPSGKPDLALITRSDAADRRPHATGCAMVFTQNRLVGAPITIGRRIRHALLSSTPQSPAPIPRALLINAGNSNSATGQQGIDDATTCCSALAAHLGLAPAQVIPSSTGIIGRLLPTDKIVSALPALVASLSTGDQADSAAMGAIMTTDLVPKHASAEAVIEGHLVKVGAIGKGAGMIAPRLDSASRATAPSATMLVFITTDAAIDTPTLQLALDSAADASFNRISVDNHASCSDTAICLSSGLAPPVDPAAPILPAGSMPPIRPGTRQFDQFIDLLRTVCADLANQIVSDGEGATRIFTVHVAGARSDLDARQIAREVVNSPLVKCAVHGRDPNWGRIVTAAGNAGVDFDPNHCSLTLADATQPDRAVHVFTEGRPNPEALKNPDLKAAMSAKHIAMHLRVGTGPGAWHFTGCDLSAEYVRVNADYTT